MRESRYDSDRAKLERLYAEMQSISQNGGSDEAYYAKKKEYQDWKSYMLREYGTTHANGILPLTYFRGETCGSLMPDKTQLPLWTATK